MKMHRHNMSVNKSSDLSDLEIAMPSLGEDFEADLELRQLPTRFQIEWLDLSRAVIEEKQTKIMARALEKNQLQKLKTLFLHNNAGDLGMRAMLNALELGYLKGLENLILWQVSSYDQITDAEEGTDAIADALKKGKMPALNMIDMTGSLPKLIPPREWNAICGRLVKCTCGRGRLHKGRDTCFSCCCCVTNSGSTQILNCFRCQFCEENVYSGDDGTRKIVRALIKFPLTTLKFLHLGDNYIGDEGCIALARLLRSGAVPALEELDLTNNPVGKVGAGKLVKSFLVNPLLTVRVKLEWPTLLLQERASAFRECNIRLEHRLAELNIQIKPESLQEGSRFKVIYSWKLQWAMQRPPPSLHRQLGRAHRLHMKCQMKDMESHTKGKGIVIKRRPWWGTSPRKSVGRELREEIDEEEEPLDTVVVFSESTPASSTAISEEIPGASPDRPSHRKHRRPLTSHIAENHIYIAAGSCGLLGAAKALGVPPKEGGGEEGFWRESYSCIRKLFTSERTTEEHIDSIMQELLMLADRKPQEFRDMFDLQRVILRDEKCPKPIYYPAYICTNCLDCLEKNGAYVKSVIPKALIDRKPRTQLTPVSLESAGSTPSEHYEPFSRQSSRYKE